MKWLLYRVCGEIILRCAFYCYRLRCDRAMCTCLRAADFFFIPLYLAGKIKIEE